MTMHNIPAFIPHKTIQTTIRHMHTLHYTPPKHTIESGVSPPFLLYTCKLGLTMGIISTLCFHVIRIIYMQVILRGSGRNTFKLSYHMCVYNMRIALQVRFCDILLTTNHKTYIFYFYEDNHGG